MKRLSDTLAVPLFVLLIMLIAALAMVKFSADRVEGAQRVLDAQSAQLLEAQARVQKSGAEKDLIMRYLPDFQRLDAMGFVGPEQRINWIDALRYANQKGALFGINYDIAASKPYPHAAAMNPGQLTVSHSLMKLRFQMLHEGDLPKFFAHLSEPNAGVFVVNACNMQRTSTTLTARFAPNMSAECELAWITAQPPPMTELRP